MIDYAEIGRLLDSGLSNKDIGKLVGVDPRTVANVRAKLGIPPYQSGRRSYPTIEAAWCSHTEPVEGGHLRWTGSFRSSGNPVFTHQGRAHSPYRIAYQMRTGREPVGKCRPECGVPYCVAPGHVDDTATRERDRAALAALTGRSAGARCCRRGHDQGVHSRRLPSGKRYCAACVRERDAARAARIAAALAGPAQDATARRQIVRGTNEHEQH